jgi:hypothetical protein
MHTKPIAVEVDLKYFNFQGSGVSGEVIRGALITTPFADAHAVSHCGDPDLCVGVMSLASLKDLLLSFRPKLMAQYIGYANYAQSVTLWLLGSSLCCGMK